MESKAKQITPINKETVHRICSGQVVLSLAIAVKELVENSMDAEATTIEIRLKEYGSESIEVSDNGKGIHPDNFEALALKHYTSKIRDFEDLVDVGTFGFRGEALSSLCALSQITVTTRHVDQDCGSRLKLDSKGVLQEIEPFPRQVGTTITLTNLFSSLPVRQKEFHRNLKKEFTKMVQLLSAYCLIADNVKISCVNQTKKGAKTTFLATQQNKNVRENISCVFGSKQLSNLLEITDTYLDDEILEEYEIKNACADKFKLRGFISSCEHGSGRSTTDRQFYYINSRPCEPTKVMKLTNEIYHRYNLHQYPFVLLNIIVSKDSVDVNVTPDKRLIFLENEKLLLACVKSTLIKLFENIPSTYKLNTPVSVLSAKNCSPSESKFIDSNKFSSFDPSKWRHSIDRTSPETVSAPCKRSLSQTYQSTSNFKQMKLDQVLKITRQKIEIDESADSTFSETDRRLSESSEDEPTVSDENISENVEITPESNNPNLSSENDFEHTAEEDIQETVVEIEEKEDNTVTDPELNYENLDFIMSDESVRINKEDSRISETEVEPECEIFASKLNHQRSESTISSPQNAEKPSSSLVNFNAINRKGVIDTSIGTLREKFSDRRQRRIKNASIINKFHVEIDPSKNQVAEEELKKEITKSMFREMKIVGQFNLGFIIAKLENDLFIVDQHATDEKYNFETLQQTTSLKSQKLIAPQDLNLTAMNECILVSNIDILRKNGFEFLVDPTAETTKKVKLISIPVSQNWQFGKEDIDEMLFMLQDAPNTLCRPSRIRAMFASRACRKSVMIGTPLSYADMRRLINNMGTIEQPWNCPHGRPTMRHLINLSLLN